MQPEQTPRQPQAFQPDETFPAPPTSAHFAGECGDPIWENEKKAQPQRQPAAQDATVPTAKETVVPPDAGREQAVPSGRIIDLVEKQSPP